jgi:hypothetical protein
VRTGPVNQGNKSTIISDLKLRTGKDNVDEVLIHVLDLGGLGPATPDICGGPGGLFNFRLPRLTHSVTNQTFRSPSKPQQPHHFHLNPAIVNVVGSPDFRAE